MGKMKVLRSQREKERDSSPAQPRRLNFIVTRDVHSAVHGTCGAESVALGVRLTR